MHWAESAEDAPEDENGLLAIEDGSTEDEDSVRAIEDGSADDGYMEDCGDEDEDCLDGTQPDPVTPPPSGRPRSPEPEVASGFSIIDPVVASREPVVSDPVVASSNPVSEPVVPSSNPVSEPVVSEPMAASSNPVSEPVVRECMVASSNPVSEPVAAPSKPIEDAQGSGKERVRPASREKVHKFDAPAEAEARRMAAQQLRAKLATRKEHIRWCAYTLSSSACLCLSDIHCMGTICY